MAKYTKETIDFRYLLTFKEIVSTGSFTEAAKRLALTQGAVSYQIKQIERLFRVKLFERGPEGTKPTPEGVALLKQSYKLQKLVNETYDLFNIAQQSIKETIRIASGEVAALTYLPSAIEGFRESHPKSEFVVQTNNALTCLKQLIGSNVDVAFVGSTDFPEFYDHRAELHVNELFERSLVAIVPPKHELGGREYVSIDELMRYDFVQRRSGSAARRARHAGPDRRGKPRGRLRGGDGCPDRRR